MPDAYECEIVLNTCGIVDREEIDEGPDLVHHCAAGRFSKHLTHECLCGHQWVD